MLIYLYFIQLLILFIYSFFFNFWCDIVTILQTQYM